MRIPIRYSADDFKAAAQLSRMQFWIRAVIFVLMLPMLFVGQLLVERDFILLGTTWIVAASLLMVFVVFEPTLTARRIAKAYAKRYPAHDLEVTENGVSLIFPNFQQRADWSAFTKSLETQDYIFLKRFDGPYHIIPKRSVPPDQQDALRSLVREKLETASRNA